MPAEKALGAEDVANRLDKVVRLMADRDYEAAQAFLKYGRGLLELIGHGVFSNSEILAAHKSGHIVIEPFNPEHVNTASYDVTLGEYFYRTDRSSHNVYFNPFDEKEVSRYFGEHHLRAIAHSQYVREHRIQPFKGIPDDHPIIVLAPGERILAHTHEFIGIRPPGVTSMQARSTWGRLGIQVCEDAGWGDSGYINRWTMEIHNGNENVHVPLPVGERVAQIVFYHTGPVDGDYSRHTGKYQTEFESIESMIKNWRPEDMLPRAYKDKREEP